MQFQFIAHMSHFLKKSQNGIPFVILASLLLFPCCTRAFLTRIYSTPLSMAVESIWLIQMPDLTTLPLEQLLHRCPPLTQPLTPEDEAAWQELQRRALLQRNDAAWDVLVAQLWSVIFIWIYERAPDTAPATAELLTQQTIWAFRQEQIPNGPMRNSSGLPASSTDDLLQFGPPSHLFPPIVAQLHHCLNRLLAD